MFELGVSQHTVKLSLYTDAHTIVGSVVTRQRRITDILNQGGEEFLVLSDVTFEGLGTSTESMQAEFAQVNLSSILFAVAHDIVEAAPEMRTAKLSEQAYISVPPFSITGQIHLLPGRSLKEALAELNDRFVPVTDATFWSDRINEPRQTVLVVAINRARAQIMAPYRAHDPWAGVSGMRVEPPGPERTGWE
jgi:hypothetical protein